MKLSNVKRKKISHRLCLLEGAIDNNLIEVTVKNQSYYIEQKSLDQLHNNMPVKQILMMLEYHEKVKEFGDDETGEFWGYRCAFENYDKAILDIVKVNDRE